MSKTKTLCRHVPGFFYIYCLRWKLSDRKCKQRLITIQNWKWWTWGTKLLHLEDFRLNTQLDIYLPYPMYCGTYRYNEKHIWFYLIYKDNDPTTRLFSVNIREDQRFFPIKNNSLSLHILHLTRAISLNIKIGKVLTETSEELYWTGWSWREQEDRNRKFETAGKRWSEAGYQTED